MHLKVQLRYLQFYVPLYVVTSGCTANHFLLISGGNAVPSRLQQDRRMMFPLLSCNEQLLEHCIAWSIKLHCCNINFSRKADVIYSGYIKRCLILTRRESIDVPGNTDFRYHVSNIEKTHPFNFSQLARFPGCSQSQMRFAVCACQPEEIMSYITSRRLFLHFGLCFSNIL